MASGIRTKTLVLLTTAAILGGGLLLFEQQLPNPNRSDTPIKKPLFHFQEADVVALKIIAPDYSLNLKKLATGNWVIDREKQIPAQEGTVVFLLNLLATGQRDRSLDVPTERARDYGLAPPRATVDITLKDGQQHRLHLGDTTFDGLKLYAEIDPPAAPRQKMTVTLVPLDLRNALQRPLREWERQQAAN
ncbi:DUF4340 domain-containing protein [Thermosynechococcus vestitus]|uniref:Tll0886 protein n=1 Tax=Thermosynechococcus vestitus (strain NIES-2133 / IAM M-273 / BP-1) TaxID=197221 RepID=Q8DKH3_THEVB|nr:DUF4340 domain-containing protein [Thermosynechococcus vestitus]BAC08438.1 tll0886 [Thermosynechococcus vestitus BP-1]BAY51378.1 hypothetical protein NIES2134_110340 [Thermostichus vulcanus NIES-2134]